MFFVLKMALFGLILLLTSKKDSILSFIHEGIKPTWIIHFYAQFLLFRLFYGIIVLTQLFINPKILAGLVCCLQIASIISLILIRPYATRLLGFQVLIGRDLNFLSSSIIFLVARVKDSPHPYYGMVQTWMNLFFCCLFLIITITSTVLSFKWIQNKLKPWFKPLNDALDRIENTLDCLRNEQNPSAQPELTSVMQL